MAGELTQGKLAVEYTDLLQQSNPTASALEVAHVADYLAERLLPLETGFAEGELPFLLVHSEVDGLRFSAFKEGRGVK